MITDSSDSRAGSRAPCHETGDLRACEFSEPQIFFVVFEIWSFAHLASQADLETPVAIILCLIAVTKRNSISLAPSAVPGMLDTQCMHVRVVPFLDLFCAAFLYDCLCCVGHGWSASHRESSLLDSSYSIMLAVILWSWTARSLTAFLLRYPLFGVMRF